MLLNNSTSLQIVAIYFNRTVVVGDLDAESDEFVCPVCGQPKKVFRKKQA